MKALVLAVIAVLAVLAAVPAIAHADVTNRDLLPFGERAGMLGNAGLTSPFGEAVFYNPANLTRLDHPTLTVVGTTYLRYSVSANPAYVIGGQDEPFTAAGFLPIPSTVISTHKAGDWTLATAILVPEAIDYKNVTSVDAMVGHLTLLEQVSKESLWIGGSAAYPITRTLSVGVSVFGQRQKESDLSFTRIAAGTDAAEETFNEDTTVYNASATLGVYWEPTPALGLALRVRPPAVRLGGTTDIYTASSEVGAMPSSTEQTVEAKASRPLPTDVTVGASVRPSEGIELVADVGLQMPATITELDDPVAGRKQFDVHLAPRVGLGAELEVAHHKWLRLGALYNGSAVDAPKVAGDESRDTYVGVTGGFAMQKERTMTSLGLFGVHGTSDVVVAGTAPPRHADARIWLYGAILSFSYRL